MLISYKRLRVLIPIVQVLLLVSATLWYDIAKHKSGDPGLLARYAPAPLDIIAKLNFPLLTLWLPIIFVLEWGFSTSSAPMPSGATLIAVSVVFAFLILSSVALFWYFAVAEAEMRTRGASFIRFSNRSLEVLKEILLAALGIGSIGYACWDCHRLLLMGQSNRFLLYESSVVDAILGGMCLVIWAIVLIAISVQDFRVFLGSEPK